MKIIPLPRWIGNATRLSTRLMAITLVATVASPLAVRAQLIYNGGTGEIEFSGQPVAANGGVPPTWAFDGFTGFNDILSSPGGGFNAVNYVNPNAGGTGVLGLGTGIFSSLGAGQYAGVAFGGSSMSIGPTATAFTIDEVAPGLASVGIAAQTSSFTVGPSGLSGTVGTILSIDGTLNADSAIAASLVTYINDTTINQSVILAEVLGATGINSGNTVALSGTFGAPASLNSWMNYGPGNTTYSGLSAASVANFMNIGDNVVITSVLTVAADPYSEIDSTDIPADLHGIVLPDTEVDMSGPFIDTPEPGAWSLLAMGLPVLLIFRKRSRP